MITASNPSDFVEALPLPAIFDTDVEIVKISNPRFLNSGYNAWFCAFALVLICLPLLNAAIEGILVQRGSTRIAVTAWIFFALNLYGTVFLAREFTSQFRYWFRQRRGIPPREDTLLDTSEKNEPHFT